MIWGMGIRGMGTGKTYTQIDKVCMSVCVCVCVCVRALATVQPQKALSMGLSVDTLSRAQAADLDRPLSLVLACLKNEKAMTTLCASADVPREEPYDSLRGQEWLQAMNTLAKKLGVSERLMHMGLSLHGAWEHPVHR